MKRLPSAYQIAKNSLNALKRTNAVPIDSGNMKDKGILAQKISSTIGVITFDVNNFPYIEYLNSGTPPHDIPFAFGTHFPHYFDKPVGKWFPYKDSGDYTPYPTGVGGRFNGKFHSGSDKHYGFIYNRCLDFVLSYICSRYNGRLR